MKKTRFYILLFILLSAIIASESLGFFSGLDNYFYDQFFRLRGNRLTSDKVVIVAIDSHSLERLGKWPVARSHYAVLLDKLALAKTVCFDILFTEGSADDQLFSEAISKHGKVILSAYLSHDKSLIRPLEILSTPTVAQIHIEPGVDHVVRELYHSIYFKGKLQPSLASAAYEALTDRPFARKKFANHIDKLIQQDKQLINYYGAGNTLPSVSMVDLLDDVYPPGFFAGKAVFIGVTASGIIDQIPTPFSQQRNKTPGVEVHATALCNLLDGTTLQACPLWFLYSILLIMSLLLMYLFTRLGEQKATLLWITVLILIPATSLAFFCLNIWIKPVIFMITTTMLFITIYLQRLAIAANRLDQECETVASLLSQVSLESENNFAGKTGLPGLLSAAGINAKVERQSKITTQLLAIREELASLLKIERETLDNQVRFIEMLSHEYRTPLAIIRANIDIMELKEQKASPDFSANYAKMKRAVSRLAEIMDSSLTSERIDYAQSKLNLKQLELVGFLQIILDEARTLWNDRVINLQQPVQQTIYLLTDKALFKTVLLNLLDNAIKHSPAEESVNVSIQADASFTTVKIQNNKPIIAHEELEKLFEKYYRGHNTNNTNTPGAGLGLFLVRKILEQLGGVIEITSDPQNGTCANVTLPIHSNTNC